jgi:hypothetical protein
MMNNSLADLMYFISFSEDMTWGESANMGGRSVSALKQLIQTRNSFNKLILTLQSWPRGSSQSDW